LQLKLFDSLVELIILYGSEVLGFWKSTNHGKIYLKFCKRILNLRLTTLNYMVYGELGRNWGQTENGLLLDETCSEREQAQ
jgi:hypothetical protein